VIHPEKPSRSAVAGTMSVMTTTSGRETAEVVRALHDEIDPPEGYRVEIVEGNITVASTPFGKHAVILRTIRMAVEGSLSPGFGAFDNTTLEEPDVDRYVPDLAVWPLALVDTETEWVFPGDQCLLAVEVTSPNQEQPGYFKAGGYARCGIPVYLVVDRARSMCVVFTEPEGDRYLTRHEVPFGKPVTVPFDPPFALETSGF
jgi:Uma2 family endonuclease